MKFNPDKRIATYDLDFMYLRTYGILTFILAWLVLLPGMSTNFNIFMRLGLSFGMFGYSFLILGEYVQKRWALESLNQPNAYEITLKEIENKNAQFKAETGMDGVVLGKSFPWDIEAAHKYRQIKTHPDVTRLIDTEPQGGGEVFTHNIGADREEDEITDLPEHSLTIGSTGVGKTRELELKAAQYIARDEAVIIIDPKGDRDLLNNIYRFCVHYGKESDFLFFSLPHINKSQTYNPFYSKLRASDIASRIKNILGSSREEVFPNFVWSIVNFSSDLLMAVDEAVTTEKLYKSIMVNPMELYQEGERQLERIQNQSMKENLESSMLSFKSNILDYPKDHMNKMIAGLRPILSALGTKEVGKVLSAERPSITWPDAIKNRRVCYFFLGSMVDEMLATMLGRLAFQDLLMFFGMEYAYSVKHYPVHIFVDETPTVIFPGFAEVINKSRGANAHLHLYLQSNADVELKAPLELAKQLYANARNLTLFRIPEYELAESFSKLFGTINYPKKVLTRAVNATHGTIDQISKNATSERLDQEEGYLVDTTLLAQLPPGQAIARIKSQNPRKILFPMISQTDLPKVDFFNTINAGISFDMSVKSHLSEMAQSEAFHFAGSVEEGPVDPLDNFTGLTDDDISM